MRRLGDRRAHMRLEVVGALWGTLELSETASVLNVSATGALIESPVPAVPDSTQSVVFFVDDEEMKVETNVRYSQRVVPEDDPPQYLIGLEFMSPPTRLVNSIEQLAVASGGESLDAR
jgi:hypothetical protein